MRRGFTGAWGSAELSAVTFDGAKLSFVRTIRMGDREFSMSYAGTLEDGVLDGAFTTDGGSFAVKGVRPTPSQRSGRTRGGVDHRRGTWSGDRRAKSSEGSLREVFALFT